MHCQQLHELAKKNSQDVPGSKHYIACFSKARGEVEQQLTDRQRQKYKAMAKEWSEKELPPQMQKRYLYGNISSGLE